MNPLSLTIDQFLNYTADGPPDLYEARGWVIRNCALSTFKVVVIDSTLAATIRELDPEETVAHVETYNPHGKLYHVLWRRADWNESVEKSRRARELSEPFRRDALNKAELNDLAEYAARTVERTLGIPWRQIKTGFDTRLRDFNYSRERFVAYLLKMEATFADTNIKLLPPHEQENHRRTEQDQQAPGQGDGAPGQGPDADGQLQPSDGSCAVSGPGESREKVSA